MKCALIFFYLAFSLSTEISNSKTHCQTFVTKSSIITLVISLLTSGIFQPLLCWGWSPKPSVRIDQSLQRMRGTDSTAFQFREAGARLQASSSLWLDKEPGNQTAEERIICAGSKKQKEKRRMGEEGQAVKKTLHLFFTRYLYFTRGKTDF